MLRTTDILIPTLGRPQRVAKLVRNIEEVTRAPYHLYFVVEEEDRESVEAVAASGAELFLNRGEARYATCINSAFDASSAPFVFQGADDIVFRDGWLEAALEGMEDPEIGVVGVRDPVNPFYDYASHSLVRRRYIEEESGCMDLSGVVLYPYRHSFADTEMVGVAKARGRYRFCPEAVVEHHHPGWYHDGRVRSDHRLFDATYAKGQASHGEDFHTFYRRARAWIGQIENRSKADRAIATLARWHRITPVVVFWRQLKDLVQRRSAA